MNNLPCILHACDYEYFLKFGVPFVRSALKHGHKVHSHIIFKDERLREYSTILPNLEDVVKEFRCQGGGFTETTEWTSSQERGYLASSRFYKVLEFLSNEHDDEGYLILDTDSVILKPIDFPKVDVSVFLRAPFNGGNEWETKGSHVAAGSVWIKNNPAGLQFMSVVCDRLDLYSYNKTRWPWFIDQVAIWEALNMSFLNLTFEPLPFSMIDWEFHDDSYVWTGKGERKYNNEKFTNKMKEHY